MQEEKDKPWLAREMTVCTKRHPGDTRCCSVEAVSPDISETVGAQGTNLVPGKAKPKEASTLLQLTLLPFRERLNTQSLVEEAGSKRFAP